MNGKIGQHYQAKVGLGWISVYTTLEKPQDFWLEAAGKISWVEPPQHAVDSSRAPLYRWFPDDVLNTSYNALDRHVEAGRGDQDALIYDSAMLGSGDASATRNSPGL